MTSRQLLIIYYLLTAKKSVTAEQLADFCSASIRTIKNEMIHINEIEEINKIIEVVSSYAKGYDIKVLDEEIYTDFKEEIISKYGFYKEVGIEKMTRRVYIAQRLLSSEYCKVEQLAEELYMTRSALKNDLVWIRKFFASYDIEVVNRPGLGMLVQGHEKDLRMSMVEAFCSQYHLLERQEDVVAFIEMFYQDIEYYQEIRQAFLKIIRESKYSMKDIYTKKMATYLVLLRNRIQAGKTVLVSPSCKRDVEGSYELRLAKTIFAIPNLFDDILYLEDEVYHFAIILLCYRDYDFSNVSEIDTYNKLYLDKTIKGLRTIISETKDQFGGALYQLELFTRYENNILSNLYPLVLCEIYDSNKRHRLATYYEVLNLVYSPLAIQMARLFIVKTEEVFKTETEKSLIYTFIILFDLILKKVNFAYQKRRLAVLSVAGKAVAREYQDFIMESFGKFVEYLDIFNQYEMRRIDFNDYDAGIIDSTSFMNNYPIPLISYPILELEDTTLSLFQSVFADGFSTGILEYLVKITHIYKDFECPHYTLLFKMLSFRYGRLNPSVLENSLVRLNRKYSFYNDSSGIAVIFCDYEVTEREFVDIYTSNHKMYWEDSQELKAVIVVSLPNTMPVSDMKTINKVLYVISEQPQYCFAIASGKVEVYQEVFNAIITNHFLRKAS